MLNGIPRESERKRVLYQPPSTSFQCRCGGIKLSAVCDSLIHLSPFIPSIQLWPATKQHQLISGPAMDASTLPLLWNHKERFPCASILRQTCPPVTSLDNMNLRLSILRQALPSKTVSRAAGLKAQLSSFKQLWRSKPLLAIKRYLQHPNKYR
jgi:hypothetical protein